MSDQTKPNNIAEKAKEQIKPKEFSLSADERTFLQYQSDLKAQHDYIASLIERDSFIYVNRDVRQRLGVGNNMALSLDLKMGKIFATPIPEPQKEETNGKVNAN